MNKLRAIWRTIRPAVLWLAMWACGIGGGVSFILYLYGYAIPLWVFIPSCVAVGIMAILFIICIYFLCAEIHQIYKQHLSDIESGK